MVKPNQKISRVQAKRNVVFEAASEVFALYGYKRTTMQDIAQAVGFSRPALYLLFDNKETLFRELTDYRLNKALDATKTKLAEKEELKIEIRHGDTSQANRKRIADNPPDILITTPETLVNLLSQKKHLDALSDLEWVVIDEVHELLASERGSQLSLSLERLQIKSKNEIH